MTIKDFDMIEVTKDVPERGVKAGMRGMVIDIHSKPTLAYEVEFDDTEQPALQVALLPEQLVKLENFSNERYVNEGRSKYHLISKQHVVIEKK